MIYLDNAATTKMLPDVIDAMRPYYEEDFGNPGALYSLGRRAKEAIDKSRVQVADLFHAHPDNIIFTSGGSEANSLVFKGVADHLEKTGKKHVIISKIEHDSVVKAAESLTKLGFYIDEVPVRKDGKVYVEDLEQMLRDDTGLVSIMYVNNETGAENPVEKIGELCKQRKILFHTDCVQAAGACDIDVNKIKCDFASVSAHKIHGPKGIGALFVSDKETLISLICGGDDQEFGLRGGTENVPCIVGFGAACKFHTDEMKWMLESKYFKHIKEAFWSVLVKNLHQYSIDNIIKLNSDISSGNKIINITFKGIDAESLLMMLDLKAVYASAGSACRSHETLPSRVLTAMGLPIEDARSSIRISFSRMNTLSDITESAKIIADCVGLLNKYHE